MEVINQVKSFLNQKALGDRFQINMKHISFSNYRVIF